MIVEARDEDGQSATDTFLVHSLLPIHSLPFEDSFPDSGVPDISLWLAHNDVSVNDSAVAPPSEPFALHLNSYPHQGDIIISLGFDLSSVENDDAVFSYAYQPQGLSDPPESADSLIVEFRNNFDEWIHVRSYPGGIVQEFVTENLQLSELWAGTGTFFHDEFQFRFLNRSSGPVGHRDSWFIDNVRLVQGVLNLNLQSTIPKKFTLHQNYPQPL